MIRIVNYLPNTNSCSWVEGWKITSDPFLAYRAQGSDHRAFLAVARGFDDRLPSKLIVTQKGTLLAVNTRPEEKIHEDFIVGHYTGGFRGHPGSTRLFGGARVLKSWESSKHCSPSISSIVVLKTEKDVAIVSLGGRYHPYFYCLRYRQEPIKISSSEEMFSWVDSELLDGLTSYSGTEVMLESDRPAYRISRFLDKSVASVYFNEWDKRMSYTEQDLAEAIKRLEGRQDPEYTLKKSVEFREKYLNKKGE
jgi:hypothetical protein